MGAMPRFVALALLLAAVAASGCGTADDRDEARAAVERFYAAVRADDGDAACAELGDALLEQVESQTGQACADVVTRFAYDGGAVEAVEVYITNAKVDLAGGESAFLGRERDGWRLAAIGCRAEEGKPADRPLECEAQA